MTFDKSAYNVKNILDSVKIQLSVPIYFFSVISHAFLLSNYRVCIIEFCVLLHFNQIGRIILKSVASHSYAELRGNNMIRSAGTRGAVKDKVKVKATDVSRLFSEH